MYIFILCVILTSYIQHIFSNLLNNVFDAANKHNTKKNSSKFKKKLVLFCKYTPQHISPKQSRKQNKVSFEKKLKIFFFQRQLKTLNKIYEKILYRVGFLKQTLNFALN